MDMVSNALGSEDELDPLVARVVRDLRADFQRRGGQLSLVEVERTIDRRKLSPEQAVDVWRLLQHAEIVPSEDPERGFLSRFAPSAGPKIASEGDSLRMYLQEVAQIRLLTPENEVELGRRVQLGQQADEELLRLSELEGCETDELEGLDVGRLREASKRGRQAWSIMVVANLRLVISIAKRYQNQSAHLEFLDIIQDGNFGLFRAVEKFDHTMGFKFSTYATWWIRQSISRGLADRGRMIRLPVHVADRLARVNSAQRRLVGELGRQPTLQELSERTEEPVEAIAFLRDAGKELVSLDAPLKIEDAEGNSLVEFIDEEDSSFENPEDVTLHRLLQEAVRESLEEFDDRDRKILEMRYGLDGGELRTLQEVGDSLELTRERVRQLQVKAEERYRNHHRRLFQLISEREQMDHPEEGESE